MIIDTIMLLPTAKFRLRFTSAFMNVPFKLSSDQRDTITVNLKTCKNWLTANQSFGSRNRGSKIGTHTNRILDT